MEHAATIKQLPCPACGFMTIEASYGSYGVCPVCEWEEDGVQLANPTSDGGANGRSLAEEQARALAKYPVTVELASGYRRSRSWRPLTSAEIAAFERLRAQTHWHHMAVVSEEEAYWALQYIGTAATPEHD
jgi:hypothetical protein